MSKFVDNHPLTRDFPDDKDAIHELKTRDAHFSRLMEEYEALDKEIVRAEQGVDHLGDLALDELKMKRVHQKDELYKIIQQKKDGN